MKKKFFFNAVLVSLSLMGSGIAVSAENYPNRAIEIVVPFPPGGIVDVVTRTLAKGLNEELKQPVIISNKPGAGGSIGASQVARSKADGYTLLAAFDTHAINPLAYQLTFDNDKDLRPVGLIATAPQVLVVHHTVPANTVAELVALLKDKPGELNYASTGTGSSNHLAAELFNYTADVDMTHIPYSGGAPAILDLVAGRVQVMFVAASSILEHVRSGNVKALAVTSTMPIQQLPSVPSIMQDYPDFKGGSWLGLIAPVNTPDSIIDTLNENLHIVINKPEVLQFFEQQALEPDLSTPEAFSTLMHSETEKWRELIKEASIEIQ